LIVPNPDALRAEIIRRRIPVFSAAQALVHADVRAIYRERIDRRLACLSQTEQIRDFALLDRGLSIDEGELTPTLKIRRPAVQAHFAEVVERMYAE
jgi:long-chain acyl-CoA synthetase